MVVRSELDEEHFRNGVIEVMYKETDTEFE
jgi:hypothetical protein